MKANWILFFSHSWYKLMNKWAVGSHVSPADHLSEPWKPSFRQALFGDISSVILFQGTVQFLKVCLRARSWENIHLLSLLYVKGRSWNPGREHKPVVGYPNPLKFSLSENLWAEYSCWKAQWCWWTDQMLSYFFCEGDFDLSILSSALCCIL